MLSEQSSTHNLIPHICKSQLLAKMERAQVKDLQPRLLQLAPWARRLGTMKQ